MNYQYETEEMPDHSDGINRRRGHRLFYFLYFLFGTIIAAIGWLAPRWHLDELFDIFHYSLYIAIAGHVLQLIALFGSMLTPDFVEEE